MHKPVCAFICLSLLLSAALPAAAQDQQDQDVDSFIALLRSDIAAEKQAMITDVMDFTEAEAAAFWPAYRTYQYELQKLGDEYVAIIKDYAAHFDTLSDEKAVELTERTFKFEQSRLKLRQTTFKQMCQLIPAVKAARWMQAENQIGSLIDLQVAANMPLAEVPPAK